MKRIAVLLTALPGSAFAHGLHAPVPDHTVAHLGPVLGLAAIVVASLVAHRRKQRRARE